MPTLNWIGKEEIVNHDKDVSFKLFKKIKSCSMGDKSKNLLIHGDNLEALKALMPYYKNQVISIYENTQELQDWINQGNSLINFVEKHKL